MSYTNNNNTNSGKLEIKEVTNSNHLNPTPAWQKLIEDGEFISSGSIMIINGGNIMDAVYAFNANLDVTVIDLSVSNDNLNEELLSAYPKINSISDDIFSLNSSYFNKFDFVYETALNLIDEPERKNYLKQLGSFIKPGGRLITIFRPSGKNGSNENRNISPVQYNKVVPDFMRLEFSSKYPVSANNKDKTEVLQVYYKHKRK